jgi:hypothetical protein
MEAATHGEVAQEEDPLAAFLTLLEGEEPQRFSNRVSLPPLQQLPSEQPPSSVDDRDGRKLGF